VKFKLRTKFILIFLFSGLFIAGLTAAVFYSAFLHLAEDHLRGELVEEAEIFASFIITGPHGIELKPSAEWQELEHVKDSDYGRYVIIADTHFNTIKKTANLGDREFQKFYDFSPTDDVGSVRVTIDSTIFLCVIYPILREGNPQAYILAASNLGQLTGYIGVFEEAILISLIPVVGISILIAYALGNRIARPLKELRKEALRMDMLTLDKRFEVRSSELEIQRLTDTLNNLFARLEKSFHQMNEFSSNVSHELRTPLTILRGNIEVGLSKDRSPEEYAEVLNDLFEETLHIINIVDALLLLARADAQRIQLHKETIQLDSYCKEVRKDWEALCGYKEQPLICRLEDHLSIEVDKELFYQLLLNLISNASKYSPEQSPIEVNVSKRVNGLVGAEFVEITVADHGAGIAPKDLERVFERFYRVEQDRSKESGGAGLGLAICKMIVELHNGKIDLASGLNKGTTAKILLPIS